MPGPILALPALAPGVATSLGIGLGSAALSIGGMALFGGNNNKGIKTGDIKKALEAGMAQINAAVAAGRANVAGAVAGMDKKIQAYTTELRDASDKETKDFWNNLGIFNEQLINSASALVEQFDGDVVKALETLQSKVEELNDGYAEDMGAEIERYGSLEDAINAKLAQDGAVSKEKFLERVSAAQTEYEAKSLAEADATKAESMSLGDQFRGRADAALGRFDSFISQSPETLDALSKSVFQTRQQLLAEADPRALELSQIADNNAAAMMSGQISSDMQANVARSSAMRALQGGFGASSEMGRGLAARDLGLTSLDLQQRGFDDYQRQRALNYETRVAGVQESARGLYGQMLSGQESLMRNTIGTAESDRNQRLGAVQEASGQRLQTFDRLFGSRLGTADTVRGQDMTLAAQLSDNARDANIRGTGMRIGATQDIYNNSLGLTDTVFNTTVGTAGQRFNTGLSLVGDLYKTNIGGAGQVYNTRTGIETNIFGGRTEAAVAGMQAQAAFEAAALQAQAGMISGNTATMANIPVMQAAQRQGGAMQSAQIWGAALQAGSSLAGSYLGSQNFSNMGGRTFGGYTGYTNNPATGNMVGYAAPTSYRPPGATSWVNT